MFFDTSILKSGAYMRLLKAVWLYARGYRHWFAASIGLSVLAQTIGLAGPYIIGQIINTLQFAGRDGIHTVLFWLGAYVAIELFDSLLTIPANLVEGRFGFKISAQLQDAIYRKLCRLPLGWHQDHHSGDVISRIENAQKSLKNFAFDYKQLIRLLISFVGPILILLHLYPTIGMVTAIAACIMMVISVKLDKKSRLLRRTVRELGHKAAGRRADYLANIRTIITLRLGEHTAIDLERKIDEIYQADKQENKWQNVRWFTNHMFINTIVTGCIAYMVLRFIEPDAVIKVGNLIIVINYLQQIAASFYNISYFYNALSQRMTDFNSIDYIQRATANVDHSLNVETSVWSSLAIRDLNFSYKNEATVAQLDNLAFPLNRGEKIALVGASGAGKSTLLTVLRGLYPTATGQVTIDHTTTADISVLGQVSTLIPQEPEIFENTIRFNITLGMEYPDSEILEACRLACFDAVLAHLPAGLDSDIREKGVNLSGGQKQRLALARGIFAIRNSSLVLFDEPTSSVDSITERRIYQNLLAAFPDICLISSIHRLHMLPLFDSVIVMDQGRIIQQGPVGQLVDEPGLLRDLLAAYHGQDELDDI